MEAGRTVLVFVVLLGALSDTTRGEELAAQSQAQHPQPDRRQFAEKLARVRDGDKQEAVRRLLGSPEDVRHAADDNSVLPGDEVWCYGTDGHSSLATLGEVWFRHGAVLSVKGGRLQFPYAAMLESVGIPAEPKGPPSPSVISESELRAGMRYLHSGSERLTELLSGLNDPLHLIRVTNYLQPLGKEKSLAIIGEYARIYDEGLDKTWLFLLLHTLFEVPQPPGHMPDIHIGTIDPAIPKDRTRIPRFPIVIIDDIPFSLLYGTTLTGSPEPVACHAAYFRKYGTIRVRKLYPPDDPYLSFQKLLRSSEWAAMANTGDNSRKISRYSGQALIQVLAIGRTAYSPPKATDHFADPTSDYDRHHKSFLETGPRWDEKLQMYVRRDGTHGQVGHLANIYNRGGKANNEPPQSPAARDHLR